MKQGWEIKKLGEIATYVNGYAFKPEHWRVTGVPIIRIQNLNNLDAEFNYCDSDIPLKFVVENGDILISWSASLGVYEWNRGKAYLNQHIFKVVFDKINISKYFLKYAVSAKLNEMFKDAHGATMKHIIKSDFDNTTIPYPPLTEQEKIVAELDCLSGIIEKKKQQLKEYDALAQSIFYEMFGNPIDNEKGWEIKTIGDVCVLKSGDSSANNTSVGTLPYVKVGDMNIEENIPYITTSSTFVSKSENIKGIFPIGTTIFPKRGGAIYTNKKRLTAVEICCDLNTMGVIPMNDVLPLYIYYYFVLLDFGELCNGAAIPQINNKDIAPLKVCVPPLALQQEFASKIEAIEKQKELIKQSIAETETLFNSRMDFYFN